MTNRMFCNIEQRFHNITWFKCYRTFIDRNKVIDDKKYNIMDGNFTPGLILLFTVFCQVSCKYNC